MITFIVPARGGSQRLKNKNIKDLNGKPLIFYTIESLLNHRLISRVLFTSDSENYCDLVEKEFGKQVSLELRPAETATNTTKVVDEVERLLLSRSDYFETEWFGMALPTAPLRDHKIVEEALKFFQKNPHPFFSCNIYDFPVQFAFRIEEDKNQNWSPVMEDSPIVTGNTRSQDIEKLYRPNGALYINSKQNFLDSKILYRNACAFEISPEASLDVDTELDFRLVEQIIKSKL